MSGLHFHLPWFLGVDLKMAQRPRNHFLHCRICSSSGMEGFSSGGGEVSTVWRAAASHVAVVYDGILGTSDPFCAFRVRRRAGISSSFLEKNTFLVRKMDR